MAKKPESDQNDHEEAPQSKREALMNPSAVDEAKVYTGTVHYFYDGGTITIPETMIVEVGKWTRAGDERNQADYLCTYYAAILLGFGKMIKWLPAGDEGERKLLIVPGFDTNNEIISFTQQKAAEIAEKINHLLQVARKSQVDLDPIDSK